MKRLANIDPWQALRRFTPARLGLGRAGESLPTEAVLAFGLDHARARDAVHMVLDAEDLARELESAGFAGLVVHSQARDRAHYLRRPDAGRQLAAGSAARLAQYSGQARGHVAGHVGHLSIVIADGLSAEAARKHALPVLLSLRMRLQGWSLAPVTVALQARVALGDAIGAALGAEAVAVFIGERPGLSAPDSMGIYLSYAPRIGMADAERNCISNVRPQGLGYDEAAQRLASLLCGARQLGRSGIGLKDGSHAVPLSLPGS
jgi:ethanolamine ammonia-lyase small subunit